MTEPVKTRPWDTAEPESFWEITGAYPPEENHTFTQCLAVTLPWHATGSERPMFVFVGPLAEEKPIDPAWITHAKPLLLVHRDEPSVPYWSEDQCWIDKAEALR